MEEAARELLLPKLWRSRTAQADQYRFINAPERISIAATGTKTGKTVGCAEKLVEWLFAPDSDGKTFWWIAPSHYQAGIGWERVKSLVPEAWVKLNESDRTLVVKGTGARAEFKTGEKPNLLFGPAVHGAIVDEASRMKEQAWIALQTTMTQTMGPIRVASNTDQGKTNWFYPLYMKGYLHNPDGSKKFPEIVSWSIKTYENPHIKPAAFKELSATLPPSAYASLIEAIFPEDALTVFRNIDAVLIDDPAGWDKLTPIIVKARSDHSYTIGVDLAKYSDYTVITVIDNDTRQVVYYNRLNMRLWESQMIMVENVCEYYGSSQVVLDSTGVGDPIFERLSLLGVPVVPYKFNNPSKQRLVDNLAIGIENVDVLIPRSLEQLITELRLYEYRISEHGVVTFSAPQRDGIFDDSVMSLALAYFGAAQPFSVGYVSAMRRSEVEEQLMKRSKRGEDTWKKRRGY